VLLIGLYGAAGTRELPRAIGRSVEFEVKFAWRGLVFSSCAPRREVLVALLPRGRPKVLRDRVPKASATEVEV
jgi:hypothetical protein